MTTKVLTAILHHNTVNLLVLTAVATDFEYVDGVNKLGKISRGFLKPGPWLHPVRHYVVHTKADTEKYMRNGTSMLQVAHKRNCGPFEK